MLCVGDVMSRPVVSVLYSTSLREAGALLADHGYAGLPVVDESDVLLGMLTCGDVLRSGPARRNTAGAVMTEPAVVAEMHTSLDDVGRLLIRRGIRSVPVVDTDGGLLGIVSRGDLLRLDLTTDDVIAVGAQKLLDDYTGRRRWVAQVQHGTVLVAGRFDGDSERRIARALVRMVPGVRDVCIGMALE
ncbi:HPP family protein [Mycolicibacterium sp. CR10]|uniref:CBS domain-containing protein n=1 Tax=Mycolicibacterium sp. CR10 TaxID=2562314 RepID=UPI0010C0759F|nr:CBS domain-containing protein [Mycolicibacterium sp. CR10]